MEYKLSKKYDTKELNKKIMGPNPIKLCEELLLNNEISLGSTVMDLGSGEGLTSVFIAKEYGFKVYAADLWSEPENNQKFFDEMNVSRDKLVPVKADATDLPFENEFFDAVVCVDSYNYFGRDKSYLDTKLLPKLKNGGLVYLAITGMKKDLHSNLPPELLLSWNAEQLEYIQDIEYWRDIFSASKNSNLEAIYEMQGNEELWADWVKQDNEYAVSDRKSVEAGALKYMNFIGVVIRKK